MKFNSVFSPMSLCIAFIIIVFSSVSESSYPDRGFGRGLNNYGGYGGPRGFVKMPNYIPFPIVKRVTHHHIHHIVGPKGLIRKNYGGEGGEGYDKDLKNSGSFGGTGKESNSYGRDFGQQGVDKRGGRYGGVVNGDISSQGKEDEGYGGIGNGYGGGLSSGIGNGYGGELPGGIGNGYGGGLPGGIGNGYGGGPPGGIEGFIGDTKAEFVPVVIGLLDDGAKDCPLKKRGEGYVNDFDKSHGLGGGYGNGYDNGFRGNGGDIYGFNGGDGRFGNERYGDESRQYSSRKGLSLPTKSRAPYIPPPETVKLFEELAKMGW